MSLQAVRKASSVCGLQQGRSQGRDVASLARQDCGKSLWTMRALVYGFLSHQSNTVSQSLGLEGSYLAEPGSPSTEAEMSEGLCGFNKRR